MKRSLDRETEIGLESVCGGAPGSGLVRVGEDFEMAEFCFLGVPALSLHECFE